MTTPRSPTQQPHLADRPPEMWLSHLGEADLSDELKLLNELSAVRVSTQGIHIIADDGGEVRPGDDGEVSVLASKIAQIGDTSVQQSEGLL